MAASTYRLHSPRERASLGLASYPVHRAKDGVATKECGSSLQAAEGHQRPRPSRDVGLVTLPTYIIPSKTNQEPRRNIYKSDTRSHCGLEAYTRVLDSGREQKLHNHDKCWWATWILGEHMLLLLLLLQVPCFF